MNKLMILSLMVLLSCAGKSENNENQEDNEAKMQNKYQFLVGAYTVDEGDGINLVEFDPNVDSLKVLAVSNASRNPSFVISNNAQNLVFTVEETGGEMGGSVSSYSLDLESGSLQKINTVSAMGNGPCYLSLDPDEGFLFVGNYSEGNLSVIPVNKDGSLSEAVQEISHKGKSVVSGRQDKSHVHSTVFHPNQSKVFVGDLGTDQINVYDFDPKAEKPLSPAKANGFKVKAGSGPRHLVFNEKGDRLYLVHEMSAEIGVYSYEEEKLAHLETHSLLREDFEGSVGAAEVRINKDGKYLYVSNRGEANEIIGFEIKEDGRLTKIQIISSGGEAPRNFALSPDEKYLVVGNQNSNHIRVFSRDEKTGQLSPKSIQLAINKPSYIYFLP